jgi:hypothetical protein
VASGGNIRFLYIPPLEQGGDLMKKGYEGTIANTGVQVVKAPLATNTKKGKATVKTGKDLRAGK